MSKHKFPPWAQEALRTEWERQARQRHKRMRDQEDKQLRAALAILGAGLLVWRCFFYA